MTTTPALIADNAGAAFREGTIERREPGPTDVVIDIKYAGICHSDIHQVREEWGKAIFPMVPGHEIAGVVQEVGSEVTDLELGDQVGVGCMVDSCRECDPCRQGLEQYCETGATMTYNGIGADGAPTYGGYSTSIVVDRRFVCTIPDALALDVAAPLLCAGITVYSPLKHWQAGPGKKVAIVGMGGLGHLGAKIASAMGAEVSVLSQSLAKESDGRRFGAEHYYATNAFKTFRELRNHFDLIINTVGAKLPMEKFVGLLKLDGTLVNVGIPPEPVKVHAFSLAMKRRSLAGSSIGGMAETQEMLNFCAEHGIGSEIETIGVKDVGAAYDRVVDSDVRYRFVIDIATFS